MWEREIEDMQVSALTYTSGALVLTLKMCHESRKIQTNSLQTVSHKLKKTACQISADSAKKKINKTANTQFFIIIFLISQTNNSNFLIKPLFPGGYFLSRSSADGGKTLLTLPVK